MNAASAPEMTRASTQKAHSAWTIYLLFALCASVYLFPFMRIIIVGRDEGSFLDGAVRIVQGQVFARDFFEIMGPGSFYWLAIFFKLFGATFLASRICLFTSSLGMALSIYYLSRRICKQNQALPCLIVAGTSFGGLWPEISHHLDSSFFGLLSVVCVVLWLDKPRNSFLIAAGILCAAATLTLQPKGLLLFCAILLWLWLQRRKTSVPLSSFLCFAGGYVAVVMLVLLYFWNQGALNGLVYANFVFPYHRYGTVNTVAYADDVFRIYWQPWAAGDGSKLLLGISVVRIIPFLFVAALPVLLLIAGIRYKWKLATPEVALYWLCGWAIWFGEIHRRDIFHLVFGSSLLIVVWVYSLTQDKNRLSKTALHILAGSAIFLVALNGCFVLIQGAHTSVTPVGKVSLIGDETILRLLKEHVQPGEKVLIYPFCPTCYFLSATANPTRYSLLVYNYNTREQLQEVVGDLENQRVKYVIWDSEFNATMNKFFPGVLPKNPNDLTIEPYLESHYSVVEDDHGIRLMARK